MCSDDLQALLQSQAMDEASDMAPAPAMSMPPSNINGITGGGGGWNKSNSVMFLIYMVIGFSVTLALILLLLVGYYFCR